MLRSGPASVCACPPCRSLSGVPALEELRASERLHEVFTELSVSGASLDEVVRQAAALAGRPVILADLSHRVLACEPGSADPARLLAGFARRSRALVSPRGRTAYDE